MTNHPRRRAGRRPATPQPTAAVAQADPQADVFTGEYVTVDGTRHPVFLRPWEKAAQYGYPVPRNGLPFLHVPGVGEVALLPGGRMRLITPDGLLALPTREQAAAALAASLDGPASTPVDQTSPDTLDGRADAFQTAAALAAQLDPTYQPPTPEMP